MRFFAFLAALIIALVTSCSSGSGQQANLPKGATVLADSAKAMREVTSTHFALDVEGNAPGVQLRSAEGQLTRAGSAKGVAKVDEGAQLLELQFVIIGQDLYLRPPTGPIQKLPLSFAGTVYDPSVILNPDRGIAGALASGTGPATEAREQVDGVDTYRLQVKFPAQPLGSLVPDLAQDKTSEIWVATQGSRLIKAQFPTTYGSATAHFSDFDAPVDITPPS
ncbi:MAG: LppX_LprAFG lipoprotein [Pseudonocardiaceae bacterium]|jgi:lipoprotein LprG|nr:LppX_LprAFG lipoprotein [Pseudonocardiaceae bacterium]